MWDGLAQRRSPTVTMSSALPEKWNRENEPARVGAGAVTLVEGSSGAVMNKALTLRGAQQHGHRYIPEILDRMSRDEVKTEHLATHVMSLDDGPKGYQMFKNEDGCVRAVFRPRG
jgi:threonine dehydrogenase-like Zn-dependent dehydrogenase